MIFQVLLVDDEPHVVESISALLETQCPYELELHAAYRAQQAIEIMKQGRIDLLITDIQMPGINGISAMREIRKTNPHTIFIIVSAFDKFDYAKEAIQLGVLEYINKPIEKTKIVDVLQKAMNIIDSQKKKRSSDLQTQEKLEIVVPIIENGLIYTMLSGKAGEEDIDNYISLLDIRQEWGTMMVIKCGDVGEKGELGNSVGTSVRIQGKYNQLKDP